MDSTAFSSSVPTAVHHHKSFDTHHEDLIHDIQPDFFGKRIATASSDRTVRIFDDENRLLATLSGGHEGPVWSVTWSHPKFGPLLASCGYDGRVVVWKEQQPESNNWIKLKEFKVSEGSVNGVAWAPPEHGLILAAGGSDGKISTFIYKTGEGSSNWEQKQWSAHVMGCNAVSFCPYMSSNLLHLSKMTSGSSSPPQSSGYPLKLVSGGNDSAVKIWAYNRGEWTLESSLQGHNDWVRDVAWNPGTPDMIASGSQDRRVLIWRNAGNSWERPQQLASTPFGETVWRVNWSVGGTLLAVSTGDNKVTVWRENVDSNWEQVNAVDPSSI